MSEQAQPQQAEPSEVSQEGEAVIATVLPAGQPPRTKRKKTKRAAVPNDRRPALKAPPAANGESSPASTRKKPSEQGQKSNTSNRAQAHANMIGFLPHANHPADVQVVNLRTEYTQKLFADHYGRSQISLYNLMTFLPIRLRQLGMDDEKAQDFVDDLEQAIDARIFDLTGRLKADLARVEKIARDNQIKPVQTRSGSLVQGSLPQLTPQIIDMLALLPLMDTYICVLDALWLQRQVPRRERDSIINTFRNEIAGLARLQMRLYWESKRLAAEGEVSKLNLSALDKVVGEVAHLDPAEEEQAKAMTKSVTDHVAASGYASE